MQTQVKPSSFISKFDFILRVCLEQIQSSQLEGVIKYDKERKKILIFDPEKFEVQVLPCYFRHNKLTSFVRQLNLYGFKKIKHTSFLCYTHPLLISGFRILDITSKKRKENNQPEQNQSDRESVENRGDIENRVEDIGPLRVKQQEVSESVQAPRVMKNRPKQETTLRYPYFPMSMPPFHSYWQMSNPYYPPFGYDPSLMFDGIPHPHKK